MIGQAQVTDPLMTALRGDRIGHAYLFSGPRGCGKTTSARILARCLNCAEGPTDTPCGTCDSCVELSRAGGGSLDVVEIDAASHNGVDDARDLRERAVFAPARDRFKIFILDEAHMVTPQGFNALLKLVEEPPAHVKFIFATTEPDKVIGTIRSRTHHYPFRLVPPAAMLQYVESLCAQEGVQVEAGVLPLVVRAGGGSPRDTLSILDQLIAGSEAGSVGYKRAVALLGYTHGELLDAVVDAFAEGDAAAAFGAVDRVVQTGQDPRRFVDDLLERLRDLIVIAATGAGASAVLRGIPADELERMAAQARRLGGEKLSKTADIVSAALDAMTGATSPRLQLELMIARVLAGALLPGAGVPVPAPAPLAPASVTPSAAPAAPAASRPAAAPTSAPRIPDPAPAASPIPDPGAASSRIPDPAPAAPIPDPGVPAASAIPDPGATSSRVPDPAPAASAIPDPGGSAPREPAPATAPSPAAARKDPAQGADAMTQAGTEAPQAADDVPAAGWATVAPGTAPAKAAPTASPAPSEPLIPEPQRADAHPAPAAEGSRQDPGASPTPPPAEKPAAPAAEKPAEAPAPAVDQPAPSGPLTHEGITAAWDEVLARLQTISRESWAVAAEARILGVRPGDVLGLGFANERDLQTFKTRTPEGGASEDLRTAIRAVLGVNVKYVANLVPAAAPRESGGRPQNGQAPAASEPSDPDPAPAARAPYDDVPPEPYDDGPYPYDDPYAAAPRAPRAGARPESPTSPARPASSASSSPASAPLRTAPAATAVLAPPSAGDWAVAAIPNPGPTPGLAVDDDPEEATVPAAERVGVLAPEGAILPTDVPIDAEDESPAEPAPAPAVVAPTVTVARRVIQTDGAQRYGEAVVRQILEARFLHEEPYEPPTRFQ
ncbi:DNA polymerase III subunit gamma and tau [Microbacterium sp. NEAU-LLB]|uniref:DNA-directed DNA polymerase n=2 Tax=Microbacterium stercoris TaxID=2820289 RepID=A0A939QRE7_9MICO|nr:DNA polymerase III subunit gamma and tau [Microbacterium stercoris]